MTLTTPTRSYLDVTADADGWRVQAHRIETYPIHLAHGLTSRAAEILAPILQQHRSPGIVVATDENIVELHLPAVLDALSTVGLPVITVVIAGGESSKSLDGLRRIWEELQHAHTTRRTLLIGVGGGVVCDLVTAAAATYMRGLPYALVPTTVLAQLDAAIGGKGGIDWAQTKNLLGAFHHPTAVLIDPELTETLPARQVRNGLAEAIKVALIADHELFTLLKDHAGDRIDAEPLTTVVRAAIGAKLALLAADPFEIGDLRRTLNLGHCVGHLSKPPPATGCRTARPSPPESPWPPP